MDTIFDVGRQSRERKSSAKPSWTKPVLLEVDSYISQSGERLYKYMYNETSLVLSAHSHQRPIGQSRRFYIQHPEKFFQTKLGLKNGITSWPLEVQQEFIQQYWQRCVNMKKHHSSAKQKKLYCLCGDALYSSEERSTGKCNLCLDWAERQAEAEIEELGEAQNEGRQKCQE